MGPMSHFAAAKGAPYQSPAKKEAKCLLGVYIYNNEEIQSLTIVGECFMAGMIFSIISAVLMRRLEVLMAG